MKNFRSLIILFLLQLLVISLHAQEQPLDYLVTVQGDTTWGKFRKNLFQLVFLVGEEKIKIKVAEHKSYYVGRDSSLYRALPVPGRENKQWCFTLEDGRIRLYEFYVSQGTNNTGATLSTTSWYATKDDSLLLDVKTNSFWGSRKARKEALLQLLSDDPDMQKEFEQAENFSIKTIRALIKKYNQRAINRSKAAAKS